MVSTESDSKVPANAINCKPQTGRVPPVALERVKEMLIKIPDKYRSKLQNNKRPMCKV